jgi:hypothetical protein
MTLIAPRPNSGKAVNREQLKTPDGRVFRIGDYVLYHASVGPGYPLLEANVTAIVAGTRGEPLLMVSLGDGEGTRMPDASSVHLDERPLPGCRWCTGRGS